MFAAWPCIYLHATIQMSIGIGISTLYETWIHTERHTHLQMLSISWWKLEMSSHLWRKLHFHQNVKRNKIEIIREMKKNNNNNNNNDSQIEFTMVCLQNPFYLFIVHKALSFGRLTFCQRNSYKYLKWKLNFSSHHLYFYRNYNLLHASFQNEKKILWNESNRNIQINKKTKYDFILP